MQPITTDLYLPALPTVQRELGASIGAAQLTLSALMICFGLSQLVCGPLADRYGRRPVLLGGLALYTVASLLGAAASSIEALIGWRALQGVAMAAAVTSGRSIVRDLFDPGEGARVMSRALGGLGIIAALAPLTGGLLIEYTNWHAVLLALAVFGAGSLAFVALRFRETVPQRDPQALRPRRLLHNWAAVVANPTFRAWAALSGLAYGGLFFMLAGSAFVFIEVLGTSRLAFGAILASMSVAYIGGTFICRRWLARHGLRGAVRRGAWFTLAGGLVDGGAEPGRRAGRLGHRAAAVPVRHRPRRAPALRAGRRGRPVPGEGRNRGLAFGLRDDAGGTRGRPVARSQPGRHCLSADARRRRGQHRPGDGRLDAGPAPWRAAPPVLGAAPRPA